MTKTSKAVTPSDFQRKNEGPSEVSKIGGWDYGSLEDAFPNVKPGLKPFGDKVLVQIRTPMTRTKTGFILPQESREVEKWNTQVAKVIAVGPVAFKNRDTLQPWPEKAWVHEGMFIRCPMYGGDRWHVRVPGSPDPALFALFRDVDLSGEIEGDPLEMVAYFE
jgi:co-chaperonin GroES (HSP10)